jgi:hypothetical protein
MPIDLKTTSSSYRVYDDGGYEFEIVTSYDPETGWSARAHVASFGMKTEQAAVMKVIEAAKKFVNLAQERPD